MNGQSVVVGFEAGVRVAVRVFGVESGSGFGLAFGAEVGVRV